MSYHHSKIKECRDYSIPILLPGSADFLWDGIDISFVLYPHRVRPAFIPSFSLLRWKNLQKLNKIYDNNITTEFVFLAFSENGRIIKEILDLNDS